MNAPGFFTAVSLFASSAVVTGLIVAATFLIIAGGWMAVAGASIFGLFGLALFLLTWWCWS